MSRITHAFPGGITKDTPGGVQTEMKIILESLSFIGNDKAL